MVAPLLNRRDLEFMLYEPFDVESMASRERYSDHNRETIDAALDTAQAVAEKYFLPYRQKVDTHQPTFDGERVDMIPEIKVALDAVVESGLASPGADYELGGMQLPALATAVSSAYLSAAGSTTMGYIGLTNANANLIDAHGTREQRTKWVEPMRSGRFAGTMAMSEPGAGSSLADLTTSAEPGEEGTYRISGNKIWISGGDHELNENIVHLVLARVKGAPRGIKGISLFIVPKFLVNDDGSLGERNDVTLAGLFHKMGGRGQTSTALNFGEKEGAVACLAAMQATIADARENSVVADFAGELEAAIATLKTVTESLLGAMLEKNIDLVLANSVKYLELFGNVVIAWMWLKQGTVAARALELNPHQDDQDFYRGKLQAMRYFFRYELPEIDAWARLLLDLDDTCYEMAVDWF